MTGQKVAMWMVATSLLSLGVDRASAQTGCGGEPDTSCCYDFWTTPSSGTHVDFSDNQIPAGFFLSESGAESQSFTGLMNLKGLPFGADSDPHTPPSADTVIWRSHDPATCDCPAPPPQDMMTVRMYALSLESTSPITIDYDRGPPEDWDVVVRLSCVADQPEGTLTATYQSCNGGTFVSSFEVLPRFDFTRVSDGEAVTLDTGDPANGLEGYLLTTSSTYLCELPGGPGPGDGGPGFVPDGTEHNKPGGRHTADPCYSCYPDPNPCSNVTQASASQQQFTPDPGFTTDPCNRYIATLKAEHEKIRAASE